jgi:hypothetical protein
MSRASSHAQRSRSPSGQDARALDIRVGQFRRPRLRVMLSLGDEAPP